MYVGCIVNCTDFSVQTRGRSPIGYFTTETDRDPLNDIGDLFGNLISGCISKFRKTQSVSQLINYGGVCRAVPAKASGSSQCCVHDALD